MTYNYNTESVCKKDRRKNIHDIKKANTVTASIKAETMLTLSFYNVSIRCFMLELTSNVTLMRFSFHETLTG